MSTYQQYPVYHTYQPAATTSTIEINGYYYTNYAQIPGMTDQVAAERQLQQTIEQRAGEFIWLRSRVNEICEYALP